jgi:hypothetical protein
MQLTLQLTSRFFVQEQMDKLENYYDKIVDQMFF